MMSKVRRHIVKKTKTSSVSKIAGVCSLCSDKLSPCEAADTVVENFMFVGYDLSALISHLQELHCMSYDEIKAGIEHIRKVVNDPVDDPFMGWERYYKFDFMPVETDK